MEYSALQNLKMAQQMLEQQREINELKEENERLRSRPSSADMLVHMLKQQHELQRTAMGRDPLLMSMEDRVAYVKDMIFALEHELHEAADEVTWKSWTKGPADINEDAFFGELVDAWHFLMNLFLVAYQIPAADLAYRLAGWYDWKRAINIKRQEDGYDGRSTKCFDCGRALDDPAVTCSNTDGLMICNASGSKA